MKQLHERLQMSGVGELSDAELLSLVLHPNARSQKTIAKYQRLVGTHPRLQELLQLDFGAFANEYGLGPVTAAKLQALVELARRLTIPATIEKYRITTPEDAARLVTPLMGYLDHEELRVLVLDTKNQVMANLLLYKGTLQTSVLRAAELFKPAITRNCASILLCHNHPSGDPTPSAEDITVTEQLVEAGKLLDIEVLDHLVIGNSSFVSLKERLRW